MIFGLLWNSSRKSISYVRLVWSLIGLMAAAATYAQSRLTTAQRRQVEVLYQQLQRRVINLPIRSVACPLRQLEQEKKADQLNETYWYGQVKWLQRNGAVACALSVLKALRPTTTHTGSYNKWLLNLGQFLQLADNTDSAFVVINQINEAEITDTETKGWVKYEKASLLRERIQFEKALQVGNEALEIARSTQNKRLEVAALSEIGNTSRDIYRQEPTKYVSSFQAAINAAQSLQDSSLLIKTYQDLVYAYFFDATLDADKAFEYFAKNLLYVHSKLTLRERFGLIFTFTSLLSYFPSESDRVINLYQNLVPIAKQLQRPKNIRMVYVYLSWEYTTAKKYQEAVTYLDSAMRYDSPDWEKDNFYAHRAQVAQALGNLKLANDYYKKALDEKERVYLRRNNQSMTQWETQFRTREKELEIEQQQRQQWLLWGVVALVSSLLALAVFFFLRNRTQLRLLAKQKAIIEEQTEELRGLDRAKTRFFSNITHEFRTPLTLILSPLEGLVHDLPEQPMLRTIQANAKRLLSLINQLLDLSRIDAGALKADISKGNLDAFVQIQTESFRSLADNREVDLQIINRIETETEAYFDTDKLSKIITNLLSNALKFTPKGGRVILQAESITSEMDDRGWPIPVHKLVLQISDTGIGIPKDQLVTIFERFYQVDSSIRRSYEGSGIGLSLVKELVEVLKGTIHVESEEGKGSTFYLRFPVDAKTWNITDDQGVEAATYVPMTAIIPTPVVEENLQRPLSETENSRIILIVEDNSDLQAYITSLFAGTYQVITANHGVEGLSKAFEYLPDAVITDWMMPEMDGVALCQRLKTDPRTSHVPVVMLTAKSAIESRLESFEGGADDYIVKPFHATELQLKVRNWLQRQERLRQLYTQQLAQPQEIPPLPEAESDFMKRIFDVIDLNLADTTFGVEKLADSLQLNRRTLQRKINILTDLSPNELIRNHRLRRALPLLKKGENIADAAFLVGFENPSYFSKCFKEVFGKKPSEMA